MIQLACLSFIYIIIIIVLICVVYLYLSTLQLDGLHKRYVLITGCDTGFGNILARSLDNKGVPVIAGCLTQQGADNLKKEASSRLKTLIIDVTDEQSVLRAAEFVKHYIPNGGLYF